ncbi:MAG: 3-hydroxyanthranilate 3,4-dioxygenase [Calditrichaeota bacterium]|nr:MAG: 3-hydroxyanthranilate 3,4-dioxygenase [Calditrichota bacterium]
MAQLAAFNFKQWIDDHRDLLKPPVGNKCVYDDAQDFIVMVVGGPNARKDYHYNEGEEFFYQIEGDITLKTIQDGKPVDVPIREGEIFLLPPKVPHSPQRPANTVGLVIERTRSRDENDGCMWFCENCGEKLYDEYFHLDRPSDIVNKLRTVMEKFHGSQELRTCKNCGTVMQAPQKN